LGDWQWEEGQIFCSAHLFTLLKIHYSTSPTNFFQAYLDRVPEHDQEKVRSQWQQAIEMVKSFTLNHFYLLPGRDRLQL
jgi:arginine/lysine/ornithine decarboxylase